MPALGIEVNGTMPSLIQDAGNALSDSLIQSGKTIETALIRSATFRQASELGQQLSQINPQSDAWPQQAAAITSQYPLAVQSGLAKMIVEPAAKAFAGYQAAKTAQIRTQGTLDAIKLRNGASTPTFTGGLTEPGMPSVAGAPSPNLTNINTDPLDVTSAGNGGIQSVLASGLGPVGAAAGAGIDAGQQTQPNDVLPPLSGPDAVQSAPPPDAATGMRTQRMPIEAALNQVGKINADAVAKGQPPPFKTQAQVDAAAFKIKSTADRIADAEAKANKPAPDLVESQTMPGVMIDKGGHPLLKTPEGGLVRPAGQYEKPRLDLAAKAQADKLSTTDKANQAKAVAQELHGVDTDLAAARRDLARYRADQIKDTTDENLKSRVFAQEKKVAELEAARAQKQAKYDSILTTTVEKVPVISPDGRKGFIPKSQLDEALKNGYTTP